MKSRRFMRSIHPTLYANLPHWLKCRLRVKSAVSTVCQRLPVYPGTLRPDIADQAMSVSCHSRKWAVYKRVLLVLANLDISAASFRIHGPKGSC